MRPPFAFEVVFVAFGIVLTTAAILIAAVLWALGSLVGVW